VETMNINYMYKECVTIL